MTSDDWASLMMKCGGEGRYAHRPATMMFERGGEGVRGETLYRCSMWGGRKFVGRTAVRNNID